MLKGHSTEKLELLTECAARISRDNPAVMERITSFEMTWSTVDGVVVPSVRIQFKNEHPRPTGGIVG
jgi:hypothetical protein